MFGSNLLDVAIGTIFTFLLLSLICSAANEILESFLKNRATDLERGLRELLDPNSNVSKDGIIASVYDHPLVNGLFKGSYENFAKYTESWLPIRWLVRFYRSRNLPSYIPARSFALALMDTVSPGSSAQTPAPGAAVASGDKLSGAAGATPPAATAAPLVVVGAAAASVAPAPNPLQPLRDKIGALKNVQTREALITLVDAAGTDVNKARENIETWFNSSMDRVSGWYKRRAQIVIFILGLAIAVALNADSVALVKALSSDKALRDSLVAEAQVYAKANAVSQPPGAGAQDKKPATEGGAQPATGAGAQDKKPATEGGVEDKKPATGSGGQDKKPATEGGVEDKKPAAGSGAQDKKPATEGGVEDKKPATGSEAQDKKPAADLPAECQKDANSPECKIAKSRQEITKLGLPFGWDSKDDPWRTLPGDTRGWWCQLGHHWLGWLITALAVSLGAPFWFDLLNKFIVVRSTVKPHEKSQEEPSK